MALKERGTPEAPEPVGPGTGSGVGSGDGTAGKRMTDRFAKAFGVSDRIPETVEEAKAMIEDLAGQQGLNAVELLMTAVELYEKLEADPENKELIAQYGGMITGMSLQDPKVLSMILATGVTAIAAIRKQDRSN